MKTIFEMARFGAKRVPFVLGAARYVGLYKKYSEFTMIRKWDYVRNLMAANEVRHVDGCVVECGVWRGGMSAGIAEILGPKREYFLFDSFEGLPPAKDIDGDSAKAWQANTTGPTYHDNCGAPIDFAQRAMQMTGVRFHLIKGWFENTLPQFTPPAPIAILRLDGDWYESTMTCLRCLFKHLAKGGIVIIDDYYTWDGCSRAVHDFLSEQKSSARVHQRHKIAVSATLHNGI